MLDQRMRPAGMDEFRDALRERGLKSTPQREAVHEAMSQLIHASADMVVDFIGETTKKRVSMASVYNILLGLSGAGIYAARMSSSGKMFFDVIPVHHIHLYDPSTDEYRDVVDEELLDMVETHFRRKRFRGFKVDSVDIQLVCHATRKNY